MKLCEILDLRFKDKEKEAEYTSVRGQYLGRDYQVTHLILFYNFN